MKNGSWHLLSFSPDFTRCFRKTIKPWRGNTSSLARHFYWKCLLPSSLTSSLNAPQAILGTLSAQLSPFTDPTRRNSEPLAISICFQPLLTLFICSTDVPLCSGWASLLIRSQGPRRCLLPLQRPRRPPKACAEDWGVAKWHSICLMCPRPWGGLSEPQHQFFKKEEIKRISNHH